MPILQLRNSVRYLLGAGSASGETRLNAFDRALLASGCGNYNLLKVSSILPAGAVITGKIEIQEGSLLPVAYARQIAGPGEWTGSPISAAVAVGVPRATDTVGVIMEYSGVCVESDAREQVTSMIYTAMADRGISEYDTIVQSSSCISSAEDFDCAFAYVALFEIDEDGGNAAE